MLNKIAKTSVPVVLIALSTAVTAGTLDIEITGFRSDQGQARIVLMHGQAEYDGKAPVFLTATTQIEDGTALWKGEGIAAGDYALIVHHDSDGNGALNRPLMGLPLEPYGYSNGAWTSFGLPDWDQVTFSVGSDRVHQHVHLRMNAFALAGQMALAGLAPLLLVLATLVAVRRFRRQSKRRA